jgi:putative MFS transporter
MTNNFTSIPELENQNLTKNLLNFTVIVAALGYFVDMYDLVLFGIVRTASLKGIGIVDPKLLVDYGLLLLNMQMIGMLVGGIVWGIMGDKKGRVSVLFGSVILYSLANIVNAFVVDIHQYAIIRFIAGVGLAGELGAAITLVTEILPKHQRGYGTAIVASVGLLGAVTAALVGDFLDWKIAYIVGGCLGLTLLLLRFKIYDSGMYQNIKESNVRKGDFFSLFTSKVRFFKYINTILLGLPTWFIIGILITLSPEFGKVLGITEPIVASKSIMFTYIGIVIGDIISGVGSQLFKSRKMALAIFISMTVLALIWYFLLWGASSFIFYACCTFLGFAAGYWAVLITVGAEQFGTNLRSTVTSTVPNFIRGATVPMTMLFTYFKNQYFVGPNAMIHSALAVGVIVYIFVYLALFNLQETYHKELDYNEEY